MSRYVFFLPSMDHEGMMFGGMELEALDEVTITEVVAVLGGCTLIPGCRGYWLDEHNRLISQNTRTLMAFSDNKLPPYFGERLRRRYNQRSFAYSVDGDLIECREQFDGVTIRERGSGV